MGVNGVRKQLPKRPGGNNAVLIQEKSEVEYCFCYNSISLPFVIVFGWIKDFIGAIFRIRGIYEALA